MNRWLMLKRFLPLAGLAAVQLVIIAAVPSKAPPSVEAAGFDPAAGGIAVDPLDGQPLDAAGNPIEVGADGPTGGGGGGGPTGGGPTGGDGINEAPAGDTSHCVNGRQFDASVVLHPPPCVASFGDGDNGGATYRGVTGDTIKVVVYRGNLGPAVDAILTAQGSNPSDEEFDAMLNAASAWINDHYQLYGRKIEAIRFNGQCASVPPDYACLRNEARQIVENHQPFAFVWNSSLASPFFDEFSKRGVVNIGGWGFRDQFAQLRRPYHYDLPMGGSQLVDLVSEWYCNRMYGNGQATAEHAGDPAFHSRPRVLGAISTDDPENKKSIDELNILLQRKCGASVAHTYFYAQDITTAEQQKRAAVNRMRESPESTTVMCFCDLVAPTFLYQESQEQAYFPEHVMVGTGFMDADASAQAYGGLPSRNDGHQYGYNFDYAFGLAQLPDEEPMASNHAARLFQATGTAGTPYPSAYRDVEYYMLLAGLLQGAGPDLTPVNLEAGAGQMLSSAPAGLGNPKLNIRSVVPTKDYTWFDSVREIYWSKQPSEFNGEAGTWAIVGDGRWYRAGEIPTGLIKVPRPPR